MPKYEVLSKEITERIQSDRDNHTFPAVAFSDSDVIRRRNLVKDKGSVWRPTFVHDIDKIMHCPYYNRYTDKTQVFSLYKNDDITRRSLHVQLVSRISRTIGAALNLNLDLIEAIALGHDLGHTPFGHAGESALSACLGEPSDETKIILDRFGFQPPKRIYNMYNQIRDLDFLTPPVLSTAVTVDRAWHLLQQHGNTALPVANEETGAFTAPSFADEEMSEIDDSFRITLTTRKNDAALINENRLAKIDSKEFTYRAIYTGDCSKAKDLAERFIKNFAKFTGNDLGKSLVEAGPKL